MTNADKIRALPNETLATVLRCCCIGSECLYCPIFDLCNTEFRTEDDWSDWLQQEAEE